MARLATLLAAALAGRSPRAAAFRAAAPPASVVSPRRSASASRLGTASQETAEAVSDDEEADADAWALRQITFLGLSAPQDDDDGDSTENPAKNALDARNLADFLMDIGACSVSVTDADADTENEDPLFDEPSLTACPDDEMGLDDDETRNWAMILPDLAAGRNLWRRCDVSAHFPASLDVPSVVDAVRYTFDCPTGPRYKVDDVPDLDWIAHVQESWTPIVTPESKFVLRFPWHDDRDVMASCQEVERERMQREMDRRFEGGVKREGAVVHFEEDSDDDEARGDAGVARKKERDYVQIKLEGGIAFGTGEHPTTRLCLDWVRDNVERALHGSNNEPIHFLDYGAGSGVLGIAAAAVVREHNVRSKRRRGPSSDASVQSITTVGVEIDADAIRIADDNARKNHVAMQSYLPGPETLDAEALSVVMRAVQRKRNRGTIHTLPDELNGPRYDLCAANILAAPLVGLAPVLASLVKSPGGRMGLSGVLASQAESVVEAYDKFFEDVKVADEDGGWVLITGTRR